MNLRLSEEQRLIRDSADSVLAELASPVRTRAAMQSDIGYDAQVWAHLARELGWCAIPIPESSGGLGLGAVELAQLGEAMGHQLLCAPFFSTVMLAVPVLMHLADEAAQARWLPEIAAGRLRATAAMPPGAEDIWQPRDLSLDAKRGDDGWRLYGEHRDLIDGHSAELLLLPARIEGEGYGWFAIEAQAAGLRRPARQTWDLTRRIAHLSADATPATRVDATSSGIEEDAQRAAAITRLCLAAEQLGGAQACLDLSLAYTTTRRQFGRALAGFQAVKHRCAQMMVDIEALRSTVYGAAAALVDDTPVAEAAADAIAALALAKDGYFFCAQEAIQLHGGVGFTWEYDPQLHLKRAQAGSHACGTAGALRARLAEDLLA